jgi:ABC-2 type transport system ATP-binding protein
MISCHSVTRRFSIPSERASFWGRLFGRGRTITPVSDLTFTINSGERVALLGRNGSGKSTIVKLLAGVIAPSEGEIRVLGEIPFQRRRSYLRQIGVMFGQKSMLFPDLSLRDALGLYAILYDLEPAVLKRHLHELDDYLGVSPLLDRPIRKLSLGQRMRCEVVAALIHHPVLILLDEPSTGMDLETKKGLSAYLVDQVGPDQGLVMVSHDQSLVLPTCRRALLLEAGQVVADRSLGSGTLPDEVTITIKYHAVLDVASLEALTRTWHSNIISPQGLRLTCPRIDLPRVQELLSRSYLLTQWSVEEARLDLDTLFAPLDGQPLSREEMVRC